ncbi:MAG: TetR/AcrR family transcriptional regulator [Flavobacteriales bacterium]|nr:TetR/AcrR family transcriptional regulator [Flavobacteriales bacterium]
MKDFLPKVSIKVNDKIYLKDPESSELGRKIIAGSIEMIEELGFENFTFGKLAQRISSTEASIYRYFESKHYLLLYLVTWYWSWMEYRLMFGLANIDSPEERLEKAITLLTEQVKEDGAFGHINEIKLNKIVICESSKAYLTKEVDTENREGIFSAYKQLVARVSDIVLEINPSYKYSHMLVSTLIEGAHSQRFFADHLPRLTDIVEGEDAIIEFSKEMVFQSIKKKNGK